MGNSKSKYTVTQNVPYSNPDCRDETDAVNAAQKRINDIEKEIDQILTDIKSLNGQIADRKAEKHAAEIRRELLRQRIDQMRDALRLGIIRLMRERRVNVTIPNEATDTYAYLSYNRNYIIEI